MPTVKLCRRCGKTQVSADRIALTCRPQLYPGAGPCKSYLIWPGAEVRIERAQAKLLRRPMVAEGAIIPRDDLVDWMWGGAADGGPTAPFLCLYQWLFRLRRSLRESGAPITIETHHGNGYELVIVKPQAVEAAA